MEHIVIGLNQVFNWLWLPLQKTPRYLDIAVVSAISGWLFMVLFKKTSNQKMIEHCKNRIVGNILQIRLYKDHPKQILNSIFQILRYNLIYLRYALVPLLVILPPVLVILMQLDNHYGYEPLKMNEPFIVRVDLDNTGQSATGSQLNSVRLHNSSAIRIETPPLRDVEDSGVFWRARIVSSTPEQPLELTVMAGNETVLRKIAVHNEKDGFAPVKRKWTLPDGLIQNAEGFLPENGSIEVVRVGYNRASYPFLWWKVDVVVLYFILTLIFGLCLKPFLKVHI